MHSKIRSSEDKLRTKPFFSLFANFNIKIALLKSGKFESRQIRHVNANERESKKLLSTKLNLLIYYEFTRGASTLKQIPIFYATLNRKTICKKQIRKLFWKGGISRLEATLSVNPRGLNKRPFTQFYIECTYVYDTI